MKKLNLEPIRTYMVKFGCDPEFFIEIENKVTGSEKIIPKKGIENNTNFNSASVRNGTKIKRDGVQCEINTRPMACRAHVHNEIVAAFMTLKKHLGDAKVISNQVIKMDKKVLDSLSKEARKFGCAPSRNAYTETTNKINVSASRYLYRSAGGHIHIGKSEGYGSQTTRIFSNIPRLVRMFDIVVGCTGTLLDRDIWAKERRKVYGKAGDYRLPTHGFEYRTLSNFWLNDHILQSLMMGLCRTACEMKMSGWDEHIFKATEELDIETIINKNDINGAIEVFNIMEQFYNLLPNYDHFPLNQSTTNPFRYLFMHGFKGRGYGNLIDYWCGRKEGHIGGFNFEIAKLKGDV